LLLCCVIYKIDNIYSIYILKLPSLIIFSSVLSSSISLCLSLIPLSSLTSAERGGGDSVSSVILVCGIDEEGEEVSIAETEDDVGSDVDEVNSDII